MHVSPAVDCIDPAGALGNRLPSGNYLTIKHHAFDLLKLHGKSLFRTAHHDSIYALQGSVPDGLDFKTTVEKNKLVGLRFKRGLE
jgi:hypothetical protein